MTIVLLFLETLVQLFFSVPLFQPHFAGLSTKDVQVSVLELSLMWGLEKSAIVEGLCFFAAKVTFDWVLVGEAGVRDWVYIRRAAVGRHSEKEPRQFCFKTKAKRKWKHLAGGGVVAMGGYPMYQ